MDYPNAGHSLNQCGPRQKPPGLPFQEAGFDSISMSEPRMAAQRRSSQPNDPGQSVPEGILRSTLQLPASEYEQLFFRGDLSLFRKRAVAVVGTRNPTELGKKRAEKVASILAKMNIVVMSGLAKGIDTVAHETALRLSGSTIAVLGTPIDRIYPASNKPLAERIAKDGLLISPALPHQQVGKHLFPRRNRLMASLSEATIIIEAGPTSGVVHQAAECLRKKRKLFLLKSLAENPALTWVTGFLKSGAIVLDSAEDLVQALQ